MGPPLTDDSGEGIGRIRDSGLTAEATSGAPVRVDRDHAMVVTGRTANQFADGLGRATKNAVGLTRRARVGDVFELVPPENLARALKDKTLRYATPSSGDASVLIKNISDGQMAGRADLRKVNSSAVRALGPIAWEVLAYATQQHFIVEISSRLSGIEKGVEELHERLDDDRVGTVTTVEGVAERCRLAAEDDGLPSERLLDELRDRTTDVEKIFNQAAATVERQVAKYRRGDLKAKEVERSFAVLIFACRRCVRPAPSSSASRTASNR